MSTFDFIDPSDFFDNSGYLSDGSEGMPDIENITDSSDNEENDVPSLKSFSKTSEDEDDLYGDYKVLEGSGKSVNLKEGYNSMPELLSDYDDSEDGNFSREFLDKEGDRLVKDLGGDAFTRTFSCAMLAKTGRVAKGVVTELHDCLLDESKTERTVSSWCESKKECLFVCGCVYCIQPSPCIARSLQHHIYVIQPPPC